MLDVMSEIGHNAIAIGTHVYVLAGVLLLAGFILGFTNWALDVPQKFFQTKSRVQLLDNRVENALGYAAIFFLLPFVVAGWRLWWGGCEIYRTVLLIQQPEHPQRDAVAVAELHTVKSQKAVWFILYL